MMVYYDYEGVDKVLTELHDAKFLLEQMDSNLSDGKDRDDLPAADILDIAEKAYYEIVELIGKFEEMQELGEEIKDGVEWDDEDEEEEDDCSL